MERKMTYQQRQKRERERMRRRRIRRIKVYLCRTLCLCVLFLLLLGAKNLLVHINSETEASFSESKKNISMPKNIKENVSKNINELEQMGFDQSMLESLFKMSEDHKAAAKVLNHIEDYPKELLELLDKNPETLDFLENYTNPSKITAIQEDLDISDLYTPGSIPHFLQWDTRWGYCQYGKNYIALSGCGPTCLSMVYVGLTGDTSKNPGVMSAFSEENGFIDADNNTMWALMTSGAQRLGLFSREISLDQSVMIHELLQGHPIILSMRPGDFTLTGHFIVVSDYKKGKFVVHDPNSKIRSEKLWDFETLSPQIKNLWSFSL